MRTPVFDEYGELEDAYRDPGHLMSRKMRLVTDTISGGKALLDFGCGQGELLSRVIGRFERVAGVDVTEKALEITRNKLGGSANASLYRYEGRMPEMEGGFDWVCCLDVLEHLEEPGEVLDELYGVMAHGGRLIVTVPNWYDIIKVRLLHLNPYHLHAHTPWGWSAMLGKAGFTVSGVRAVGFPVIDSDLLARKLYFLGMCIFVLAEKP